MNQTKIINPSLQLNSLAPCELSFSEVNSINDPMDRLSLFSFTEEFPAVQIQELKGKEQQVPEQSSELHSSTEDVSGDERLRVKLRKRGKKLPNGLLSQYGAKTRLQHKIMSKLERQSRPETERQKSAREIIKTSIKAEIEQAGRTFLEQAAKTDRSGFWNMSNLQFEASITPVSLVNDKKKPKSSFREDLVLGFYSLKQNSSNVEEEFAETYEDVGKILDLMREQLFLKQKTQ